MTKKPKKRNRKKRQIYTGVLSEPGPRRLRLPISFWLAPHTFFGDRPAKQIKDEVEREIAPDAKNLLLLMDHYGIGRERKDCWRLLAFALARDHVPAFRNPPIKGRPKSDIDKLEVYVAVNKKRASNKRFSVSQAIEFVQKQIYPGVASKTVAGWYYDAVSAVEARSRGSIETRKLDELHRNWSLTRPRDSIETRKLDELHKDWALSQDRKRNAK